MKNEKTIFVYYVMIVIVMIAMLLSHDTSADDKSSGIDRAISVLIQYAPNHRLHNMENRAVFIDAINKASESNDIDVSLILSIAFLESSLNPGAIGWKKNEIGLMQVHGKAAKGCDLKTEFGQLDCGAAWLKYCKNKCSTWD